MSFITQIQAGLQGCVIDTPHSDDIRAIVGTDMCAGASPENDVLAPLNFQDATVWFENPGSVATGTTTFTTDGVQPTGVYCYVLASPVITPGETYIVTASGMSGGYTINTRDVNFGSGDVLLSVDGTAQWTAGGPDPNLYLRSALNAAHSITSLKAVLV